MRYAQMEFDAGEIARSRSVFERALSIDYTYVPLWLLYAQLEARAQQYANSVSVLERATSLLPNESKLWLTYVEYEELRGNYDHCRAIFSRWVHTGGRQAWNTCLAFEKRYNPKSVSQVLKEWVKSEPSCIDAWMKLASASQTDAERRQIYTDALESRSLSVEDARVIKSKLEGLKDPRASSRSDDALELLKQSISENGNSVDLWWATVNMNRPELRITLLKEAVERCTPSASPQKTLEWRKYALLWLRLALTIELQGQNEEVIEVYEAALKRWDHSKFTSGTLWINYASFYIRISRIDLCRKLLGSGLRKTKHNFAGNQRLLGFYIFVEKKLLQTDRVRHLYDILCSNWPQVSKSWVAYAHFELELKELKRCHSIYNEAESFVSSMDDPDALWLSWAEFVADHDIEAARSIWRRAVDEGRDKADIIAHYAMFEVGTGLDESSDIPDSDAVLRAKDVFKEGLHLLSASTDQRQSLLDYIEQFEDTYGPLSVTADEPAASPEVAQSQEGSSPPGGLHRLLAKAHEWKSQQSA